ncbi:hypothetical protein GGX14DRAFT_412111 [Mycena pura]|uniref:Protein YOP1 n=1 Tax=Mycena pura TaxID=153505 RepID=A0AAD6YS38_9AGAR|nr:hypothetical protein GGX14DRAFT_412111 [Mycena pura]
MALGVHLLRLMMLLLNIYDTYKVLKRPRRSARSAGQPAARALSQRKRQMKGCLAVWIVWCCFMTYESIAEGVVSLLIPFYDTAKSLVLMFLILTRARGAEPIFLHVIRPLVKPYTASLDAVANVAHMFGDFVFLLSMYPFRLMWEWWQAHWESAADEAQHAMHSILQHPSSLQPGGGQRRSVPVGPVRGDVRFPFVTAHRQPSADGTCHSRNLASASVLICR